MSELGSLINSISLKAGLFGKKPNGVDVYEKGLVLKYKNEERVLPFSEISAIKSLNYGAPQPPQYDLDIYDKDDKKIISLAIPYAQLSDATLIFKTHEKYVLPTSARELIKTTDFELDPYLSWKNGSLFYKTRKGIQEYSPRDIDQFCIKNGSHYFTLKDSKDTVMLFVSDSFNVLAAIEICRAIADIDHS